ncbi:hypothetical protein OY671_012515, partial [Metschnikowia pulcherrima]
AARIKGTPSPSEYAARRAPPLRPAEDVETASTAPSTGPMQGVQPKAKAIPRR